MDQDQCMHTDYEAPCADVVELTGEARCISTSVPIDNNATNIDPSDIG
ncbi:hypothetical protein I3I95_05100 [bacterium]|nr:hypothetical protein [bacterium]